MNRVVITGIGAITPIGDSLEEIENNLYNGVSGIVWDNRFNTVHGLVKIPIDSYFTSTEKNMTDRVAQLAYISYIKAKKDANSITPEGLFYGVSYGGASTVEESYEALFKGKKLSPTSIVKAMPNNGSSFICSKEGIIGPCITYSAACSSSGVAMGEAFSKIKSGEYTSLAVVGAESVSTKLNSVWWRNIHAINETEEDPRTAVSPFSKNRKGTALSEGAVCLFLENLEIALARNAKIYAEIISYSINTGTETFTKPSLSSQKLLMIDAINKVGIDNVTYINAHGTGTPVGDISELQAINEALGSYCKNIPISSTKSLTGHLMGAASAMESISCILTLKNNKVIPNFFLTERDPIINQDIFLPTTPVTSDMNVVLNNSFAFGGTNVILGFKKWK